jgi:Leucine-rich repeat (LRR) protein
VSKNDLGGPIPTDIGELVNLQYLYAYENRLSGELPASMAKLKKLQYLALRSNELTGGLEALSACTALVNVELQVNKFEGSIPTVFFADMCKLKWLRLEVRV